jgi:FKBP-type peptidyl-prolyl cis-trans isomerase FklB
MNNYMMQLQSEKSKPRMDSGTTFLTKNKTKPGVKTTDSGLQYEMIRAGNGVNPTAADSVTVNYKGTFLDGSVFDNSYDRGQPITFPLSGVIKGWTEGLQLMDEGSKYKLYVPFNLGYGAADYGPIPGGSTLIFEVELLKVLKTAK